MTLSNKQEALGHAVETIARDIAESFKDNDSLYQTFINCYESTAKTTTKFLPDGEAFVFTGDIAAMWLRDSSAQVVHYLPYISKYPILAEFVHGLIKRQMRYILIDPYANAFNETANGHCWEVDETASSPWDWERKYEVDSLCYPIWLIHEYWRRTEDESVFTDEVKQVFETIIELWKKEQNHDTASDYRFVRHNCPDSDTLSNDGKSDPTGYTGMTWSGFRPSDDACKYGYLIPANMFAHVVLGHIEEISMVIYKDEALAQKATALRRDIHQGIEQHGIVKDEEYGHIYAYETDGLGHYHLMDDANVPSLLSIPWLNYTGGDETVYQNTRRFILSRKNPYYYEGAYAKGIGSPHTPESYIWHISLTMQGLTAESIEEKQTLLATLLSTDAGKKVMHEGFDVDNPENFTREWFAWANSLFALLVMDLNKDEHTLNNRRVSDR